MITFKKGTLEENLVPKAIEYLEEEGVPFNKISPKEADSASKVNSKSMVLMSFVKTNKGFYQITVKDKEFYAYTRKLLKDYCRLRITSEDQKKRTFTGETDHLGIALDIIEVLGIKYNLSIVEG